MPRDGLSTRAPATGTRPTTPTERADHPTNDLNARVSPPSPRPKGRILSVGRTAGKRGPTRGALRSSADAQGERAGHLGAARLARTRPRSIRPFAYDGRFQAQRRLSLRVTSGSTSNWSPSVARHSTSVNPSIAGRTTSSTVKGLLARGIGGDMLMLAKLRYLPVSFRAPRPPSAFSTCTSGRNRVSPRAIAICPSGDHDGQSS